MSVARAVRAFPTLLRVGFAEAIAYRAEMFVWVLATTMPLVMLALWSAVAKDAPIGRFGEAQFVAYFLATFIVRQLTGSWISWQMNMEIRQGAIAMRLLRPVPPLVGYAAESVAQMPMRVVVCVPIAFAILISIGAGQITRDPVLLGLWLVSVAGGWLVTLFVNLTIGCLAFFIESSTKVMDVWLAFFFVLSGYMVPVELFHGVTRTLADVLPFRYQIGLPVEILTGALDRGAALRLLGVQWAWVAATFVTTAITWKKGIARFSAYGG